MRTRLLAAISRSKPTLIATTLAAMTATTLLAPAHADDIAAFYSGKTVTFISGSSTAVRMIGSRLIAPPPWQAHSRLPTADRTALSAQHTVSPGSLAENYPWYSRAELLDWSGLGGQSARPDRVA